MTETINPFANTVIHFSDSRLMSIIKSPHDFAPKLLEAAKIEAGERELIKFDKTAITHSGQSSHLTIIRQNLGFGVSIEECEEYLLSEGLSKEEALVILNQAVELGPLKKEVKTKTHKEESGPSIWFILFAIFVVVKLIWRLSS